MTEPIVGLAWVALGSALGGVARFFISGYIGRRIGETFPWGTMAVNVSGSLAVGFAAGIAGMATTQPPSHLWQLAVTGFLGSYTTVSSFSLQTLALARDGQLLRAAGNVLLSLALCIGCLAAGAAFGAAVAGTAG